MPTGGVDILVESFFFILICAIFLFIFYIPNLKSPSTFNTPSTHIVSSILSKALL
jgi:hypothetical protein